jgi:phage tail sheath protein FI
LIAGVETSICAFVGRASQGTALQAIEVCAFSDFEAVFGGLRTDSPMTYGIYDFFAQGGQRALVVRVKSSGGGLLSEDDYLRGLAILEDETLVPDLSLLCVPPDARDGDTAPGVYGAAARLCRKRRAFLIVDPPRSWGEDRDISQLTSSDFGSDLGIDAHSGEARFAAVYFPRVIAPDTRNSGIPTEVSTSGAIAGLYASIAARRGVWKPPAGVRASLKGATALATRLTDENLRTLNTEGINPLLSRRGIGNVVWGARTLAGAEGGEVRYRYVPVRRLTNYIELSLARSLVWTARQQNNAALWARVEDAVGVFMQDLREREAFINYAVRCDASTTSEDDIKNGIARLRVGFAPMGPGEFHYVLVQLTTL